MYQCYYSPDRCSFLTVECHKYGLSFMSQLPGDHPFKFQVIRALQNLVKLIEGWNKVLFQILKTCGFGTLEMFFPCPVNSLDVCSSKIFFFYTLNLQIIYPLKTEQQTERQSWFFWGSKAGQYCRRFISLAILCRHPKSFVVEENSGRQGSAHFRPAHLATTAPDKPLWILLIPWQNKDDNYPPFIWFS